MRDLLAYKIAELGLDRRGVLSPVQKAHAEMARMTAKVGRGPVPSAARVLETPVSISPDIVDYDAIVDAMAPEDRLELLPYAEGDGDFDLVEVLTARGQHVGVLPSSNGKMVLELINKGEVVFAKVQEIDTTDAGTELSLDVYLEKM